jgi:hypothetical protein
MSYRKEDHHHVVVHHRTEMNENGTLVVVVAAESTPQPPSPLSSSSSSSPPSSSSSLIPTPTLELQEQVVPPSPSPPQSSQSSSSSTTTTALKPLRPPPLPLHVVVLLVDQDCRHFEVVRVEVQPNEVIVSEVLAQASARAIHTSLQTQSYQGLCCNDGSFGEHQRLIGPTCPLTELKHQSSNSNNHHNTTTTNTTTTTTTTTTNIWMMEEKGSVRTRPILALAVPMNIKVDDFVQKARAILGHPIVLEEVRSMIEFVWLAWLVLARLGVAGFCGFLDGWIQCNEPKLNQSTIPLVPTTTHTRFLWVF